MTGYTPLTPATIDMPQMSADWPRTALHDMNAGGGNGVGDAQSSVNGSQTSYGGGRAVGPASIAGGVTVVGSAPAMAQPIVQKTSAYDVLRRLLQSKNMMVSVNDSGKQHVYAAHLCLLQGDVAWDEVQRGISRLREARTVAFASCVPATVGVRRARHGCTHSQYNAYVTKSSPYVRQAHRVSGLMLANHTSIRCARWR
jgi:hypothetical protein